MKQIKVQSKHSWFDDQSMIMTVSNDGKVESIKCLNKNGETELDLHDPDECIKHIVHLFMLTGTTPDDLIIDGCEIDDFYKLIYGMDLNVPKFRFLKYGYCGCNMGHCTALLNIEEDDTRYTNLGELFKEFAMGWCEKEYEYNSKKFTWYEHPDSVYLYLERVTELPKLNSADYYNHNKTFDSSLVMDPEKIYVSWGYSR